MNNRADAIKGLQEFFASERKFLFFNGTHQNQKHVLALAAAFQLSPAQSRILFRSNAKSNTGMFLGDLGIKKVPDSGEWLRVSDRHLAADTINPQSWKKSPRPVDIAIIYPVDSMSGDEGSDCVADIVRRQAKKILMVTWTDSRDFGWADQFDPMRITYDVEEEQPEYHERMREIEASPIKTDVPKNLPAYAKKGDPARLIRLHCRGCNTTSWAELNVPYPGKAALRDSSLSYVAKCLKCGRENTDNYNWYGRE